MEDLAMEMEVIGDVKDELRRQYDKFGMQEHGPFVWTSIIGEELGEVDEAALKARFGGGLTMEDYRRELIEVAASAIAAATCYDRGREQGDD
jgi:NTP pyrophosphatase (non-canonical NTP hydrolase)